MKTNLTLFLALLFGLALMALAGCQSAPKPAVVPVQAMPEPALIRQSSQEQAPVGFSREIGVNRIYNPGHYYWGPIEPEQLFLVYWDSNAMVNLYESHDLHTWAMVAHRDWDTGIVVRAMAPAFWQAEYEGSQVRLKIKPL